MAPRADMEKKWSVYILRCADGTLYTGVTTDIQRRFRAHQSGKGAKYTRGRGPLQLVYTQVCPDKPSAFRREWELKHMSREEKLALCQIDA